MPYAGDAPVMARLIPPSLRVRRCRPHPVAATVVAGLVVLALAGCEWGADGKAAPGADAGPPTVSTVVVEVASVPRTLDLPGRLASTRVAEVRAQVAGIIRERAFEEGSLVRKGDVLFRIDAAVYRAEVDAKAAALARAEATKVQAQRQSERTETLLERQAVSAAQQDIAVAATRPRPGSSTRPCRPWPGPDHRPSGSRCRGCRPPGSPPLALSRPSGTAPGSRGSTSPCGALGCATRPCRPASASPGPGAVALNQPLGAPLTVGCPGQAAHLQLHQSLGCKTDHLAQQIGVGTLLHQPTQGHDLVGNRGSLGFGLGRRYPTLPGNPPMTTPHLHHRLGHDPSARCGHA
ncbi:RND family efflux transporter, MFP subunit [Methylobacterium sp. ap11]|nr:RND family efflux transporter, MFP subunit [Methylobacterium sp. ap11]